MIVFLWKLWNGFNLCGHAATCESCGETFRCRSNRKHTKLGFHHMKFTNFGHKHHMSLGTMVFTRQNIWSD